MLWGGGNRNKTRVKFHGVASLDSLLLIDTNGLAFDDKADSNSSPD